jgi:uncharacterized protein
MTHAVSNVGELRALYGNLPEDALALKIMLPRLDKLHRAFIALSPFMVMATADALGRPDVSPRGDLPGFVRIVDDTTLLIPDRPGNKKLTSLTNLLANSGIALMFFVPGRDETLRVKGRATITTEPAELTSLAAQGKRPRSAIRMRVEKAYFHCGKALIRSELWASDGTANRTALPSFAQMLSEQVAGLPLREAEERVESSYKERLWDEPAR